MKYQAVIFDIDGTLLDSVDQHAESWRLVFEQYGKAISFPDVRKQIGKGGDQLLPVFFSEEEIARDGKSMEADRAKLFKDRFLPKLQPFPSVRALFERMKQDGLVLALASSAKAHEVEHYAKLLEIEDLITTGTSSDDAERSKPHPDIFQAAVTKLGDVSPEQTLVVGDTPYDVEAAGKLGIQSVGLLCGGFPEADLREAGAIAIYQDPADLLRRYENSVFKAQG